MNQHNIERRESGPASQDRTDDEAFEQPAAPTMADVVDALRAAVAFVELYTGNGVQDQPPEWAADFDADKIAKHCRAVLAQIVGAS